jgi:predicted nucleotidyltransferase
MSNNNLITINKIISHIKELIEFDCDVKLYGSYATGSSLLLSDIDIVIIPNKEIFTNFLKNNDSII